MDLNLDGKVYWDEYWQWAQPHFIKKGWDPEQVKKYKPLFKKKFEEVAGDDGFMTYADFLEAIKEKYGIKDD